MASKSFALLLFVAALAPALAFHVGGPVPMTRAMTHVSPPSIAMTEGEFGPLEAVFAGGGALGVVFAAYCTSTGSPPTGLLVATASVVFMAAGATLIEDKGLPKRE